MDINFWTQSNPNIKFEQTHKKYYAKYLYKLVLYAPVARIIHSKVSIDHAFAHRKNMVRDINYAGWWGGRNKTKDLDNADLAFLQQLKDLASDQTLDIRMRVEEPRVQIYAKTESVLIQLVNSKLSPHWLKYIEAVAGPENKAAESLLNQNAILRKKHNGFQYKVMLRDGRYGAVLKQQILNYLDNLGTDVVKVTPSVRGMLNQSNNQYLWNAYFFTNDPNIVSFIGLMSPGMIGNIHELVVPPDK